MFIPHVFPPNIVKCFSEVNDCAEKMSIWVNKLSDNRNRRDEDEN